MTKPRLIDRLITICLCVYLAIAFWYLYASFTFHNKILSGIS